MDETINESLVLYTTQATIEVRTTLRLYAVWGLGWSRFAPQVEGALLSKIPSGVPVSNETTLYLCLYTCRRMWHEAAAVSIL